MPTNFQALDALRRLSSQAYSPQYDSSQSDPTVQKYNLDTQLADETKDRMIQAQRAQAAYLGSSTPSMAQSYGGEVTALQNMLSGYNQDIQESGIPQGIDEADAYRQKQRDAILSGFPGGMYQGKQYANPLAAQAEAGRQMEQSKIDAPIHAAEVKASGDAEAQRLQNKGLLDVAQEKGSQAAANLAAFLQGQQSTGGVGQRSWSFNPQTGAVSQGAARPDQGINVQLAKQVTAARQAYETAKANQSGIGSFFGFPDSNVNKAQAVYQQAVGQLFAASGYDPDVQELAAHIYTDPNLNPLSVENALPHITDEQGNPVSLSPEQKAQVEQLLRYARGLEAAQPATPDWYGQGGM